MSNQVWIAIILIVIFIGSVIFMRLMVRRYPWIKDLYDELEESLPDALYPLIFPLLGLFMALGLIRAIWKSESNKEES